MSRTTGSASQGSVRRTMRPRAFSRSNSGSNRYERLTVLDLVAADEYWRKIAPYWAAVRRAWAEVLAREDRFVLQTVRKRQQLFMEHFSFAVKLAAGEVNDPTEIERYASETIHAFVDPAPRR